MDQGPLDVGLFLVAFIYFAGAIGAVCFLFLRGRLRRRSRL